jgi:hypothetical protein
MNRKAYVLALAAEIGKQAEKLASGSYPMPEAAMALLEENVAALRFAVIRKSVR